MVAMFPVPAKFAALMEKFEKSKMNAVSGHNRHCTRGTDRTVD